MCWVYFLLYSYTQSGQLFLIHPTTCYCNILSFYVIISPTPFQLATDTPMATLQHYYHCRCLHILQNPPPHWHYRRTIWEYILSLGLTPIPLKLGLFRALWGLNVPKIDPIDDSSSDMLSDIFLPRRHLLPYIPPGIYSGGGLLLG